jgi:hypothetical protein
MNKKRKNNLIKESYKKKPKKRKLTLRLKFMIKKIKKFFRF